MLTNINFYCSFISLILEAVTIFTLSMHSLGFPGGARGKEPAGQCRRPKRRRFDHWVKTIPWRRAWQPTPVFLPGESHAQRSLVGYSPWGHKETRLKQLSTHTSTCTLYSDVFLWTFLKPDRMAWYSTLCILVALTVTDYTHYKDCSYLYVISSRTQEVGLLCHSESHKCSSPAQPIWQKLNSQAAFFHFMSRLGGSQCKHSL